MVKNWVIGLVAIVVMAASAEAAPPVLSVEQSHSEFESFLSALIEDSADFTSTDYAKTCADAGRDLAKIQEAETKLKANTDQLKAKGSDVSVLNDDLSVMSRLRENYITAQKRACRRAENKGREAQIFADGQRFRDDYQASIKALEAAMETKDRKKVCQASLQSLTALMGLQRVLKESLSIDADLLTPEESALMDNDQKWLDKQIADTSDLMAMTCSPEA
jgi:DNA repair ATPase RecN